jgi:aminopeptidase N
LLKWRPDVWFNNYDGLKLGLHANGQYMKQKHVFSATVWYNSGWLNQRNVNLYNAETEILPIHYTANYKHRFAKFTDVFAQSALLDGLNRNTLGVAWQNGANGFKIFAKSLHRNQRYYLPAYQNAAVSVGNLMPNLSSHHQFNNTLNLGYERLFGYAKGNAKLQLNVKTALLGSDFNYSGADLQLIQSHPIAKLELRSRFYAAVLTGDIAPESQLYLAGANPEEMFENKYHRSAGMLPAEWFSYGQIANSYHAAGGLNLRGYAGYLVPIMDGFSQTYLYRGNAGASCNLELDYDKLIPLRLGKLSNYFSLDAYLFLDAGILGSQTSVNNEFTLPQSGRKLHTGLMASAGHGLVLTIKKWGVLDEVKPLQIRFDTPFFLSNAPFASPENLQMRWVIGVGRSF